MDFIIKNIKENIVSVARKIGYVIIDTKENNEYNLVRKLAGDNYPRFHVYVKQKLARHNAGALGGDNDFEFSLHLDQKKPVYKGQRAHSGEYFGPVVEEEADRIKEILTAHPV
ncbi:MAG: hypothetical protein A2402_00145 [Candidatus Staskawiczbacteria bacterium RIFOXYC1_FULL_37_43]|nr:MAG: hypothetical protein A2813_02455 [Candidatus Staskawiczbacteria bacterium RIFCSPHIGHO2_01_FULL_37_17]OGZ71913.1 MAG: hypothetical protein A2891_00490 [Candidatus Staskawiczbacteria bacterium RIFCSPLOWO2_01_FULL_37_19]OGZ76040.1 MAG: hypothetical protein A2205_03200 [Candidatus Staskawiczbacteria bacterium RIFOXYA1_FULL_37_15]OGZ76941.1 MAG: hypothetical protein A2280_01325 [Candidatus Staskawiczbacteria bacterium RIFOXYA12_FULL_37_10]OGZ80009.1 MAG: hypothetical protein A2353_01935 [Can